MTQDNFKIFKKFPELFISFSKVSDGNMAYVWGGDSPETVESNRANFCKTVGIDINKVVAVSLQHGNKVIAPPADQGGLGMRPDSQDSFEADGLVTDQKQLGLCFVIADCMPIVVYDPQNQALGLFHAGRKGVEKEILKVGIGKLSNLYGSKPTNLLVGIGPSISAKSYVFDSAEDINLGFWGKHLKSTGGKLHMDIKAKTKDQLLELGVRAEQIEILNIDTFNDTNYYSHRRSAVIGETEGRFAAVAYLT